MIPQNNDRDKKSNDNLVESPFAGLGLESLLAAVDAHAIVVMTDRKGVITYVNDHFCNLSQFSREELVGKTHRIVNSGYHAAAFWEEMWSTISRAQVWKGQICNRAKDGSSYWVETTIYPIKGKNGEVEQFLALRTEITFEKETQLKLQISENQLSEAARIAKLGSWEYDVITGEIIWSDMTREIHEVDPSFVPTLENAIGFYEEGWSREKVTEIFSNVIENGGTFEEDLLLVTATGKRKWVSSKGKAVMASGNCTRIFGTFQDVDAKKREREELDRISTLLSNILGSATELSIVATDTSGVIQVFNTGSERLLGYKSDELVGKATPEVLHLKSEIVNRATELSAKTGQDIRGFDAFVHVSKTLGSESREWTYVHKDGHHIPVSLVVTPIKNGEGELTGFLGMGLDITDRRNFESQILESEQRFRGAFEGSGIGMALVDMHGNILQTNESLHEIFGYDQNELVSRSLNDLLHPSDRSQAELLTEESFNQKSSFIKQIRKYVREDGQVISVNQTISLVRDRCEEAVYFIFQIEDITSQLNLQNRLSEMSERLSLATRAGGVGIWDWDIENDELVWDEQMFVLYGTRREDCASASEARLAGMHPEDLEASKREVEECIETGREFDSEYRVVWPDGSVRSLRAMAQVQTDESGKPIRMVGTNWDVTQTVEQWGRLYRLANEAEEANQAKSQFLANMSHEIRTPMNGIIGMTSLLLDSDDLTSEDRQYGEVIRSSGESLLALVNDILDFSKVEARKLDLETIDFRLRDTLDDFVSVLAHRASEKGLELTCEVRPGVPDGLKGDPGRLRQILLNLAGNAIKFTNKGSVRVEVALEALEEESATLRFEVRDTGIGISEKAKMSLFQEFSQADSSMTRVYGGTGLGLAITKQLTSLMNGQVGFSSTEGNGSTFWFTIKTGLVSKDTRKMDTFSDLAESLALIIDPVEEDRKWLIDQFGMWGMKAHGLENASQALEMLSSRLESNRPYSYVIVDAGIGDSEVFELAQDIRRNSEFDKIRLLYCSGIGKRGSKSALAHAGYGGFFSKPARQSEVFDALQDIADVESGKSVSYMHMSTERFSNCKARILLAEDNAVNQLVVGGTLEKFGLRADFVGNGTEALDALRSIRYDLVLMDVQMPEMDGLEACRRIRLGEAGAENAKIPVIALTAHTRKEDAEDCLKSGMNGHLSKPLEPRELYSVLESYFPAPIARSDHKIEIEEKMSNRNAEEIFDEKLFLENLMDDTELASMVAKQALSDLKMRSESTSGALETGAIDELSVNFHSIKGIAANCYCNRLKELVSEMESKAKEGDIDHVKSNASEVFRAIEEVSSRLNSFNLQIRN